MKRKFSVNSLLSLLMVAMAIIAALGLFALRDIDKELIDIDDGWDITVFDKQYQNVSLSDFVVPETIKKGDTMILERDMSMLGDDLYSIRIYTRLSSIVVYADESVIYSYMPDAVETGEFTGSGYHFVLLPSNMEKRHLTVIIRACENGAFQSPFEMELSPTDVIYNDFAVEREIGMIISIFLVVAGFMISLIAIVSMTINSDFYPLIMIGIFAVCAGIWALCSMKIFQFFSVPIALGADIEYMTMFLLPLPIIRLSLWQREHMPRLERTALQIMFWVYLSFLAVMTLFHFANIVHFPVVTFVFHATMMVSIPLLLFVRPGQWGCLSASERMFQIGMWITVCVGIFDIIWYYLCRFVFNTVNKFSDTALPLGFLCMVSVLLLSYLLDLYARRMNESEKNQLEKLAYQDELTGLANRARGEQVLEEARDWKEEYAIVNLDLNGLKTINDKYGHAQGDIYLTRFATVLGEIFAREVLVARMGGDEFFVIIRGSDRIAKLSGLLTAMQQRELEMSGEVEFLIDASYGVARSSELTFPNPEALYRMADQRMYKMKMLSKKGRM